MANGRENEENHKPDGERRLPRQRPQLRVRGRESLQDRDLRECRRHAGTCSTGNSDSTAVDSVACASVASDATRRRAGIVSSAIAPPVALPTRRNRLSSPYKIDNRSPTLASPIPRPVERDAFSRPTP